MPINRDVLIELRARVVEAKGADREIDARLKLVIHPELASAPWKQASPGMFVDASDTAGDHVEYAGRYTGSTDAALALVERLLPGWVIDRFSDQASGQIGNLKPFGAHVEITDGQRSAEGQAALRPLAILAALLSALLAQEAAHG